MSLVSGTKSVGPRHPGIYAYETKQGKRYAFVATVEGRQRWGRGFRSIIEAEEARDGIRQAMRSGMLGTASARLLLSDFLNQWLPTMEGQVTVSTMRNYRLHVDRIITAEVRAGSKFGDTRLMQLGPQQAEAFKAWLHHSGLSASSQSQTFIRLSQALGRAVRWGLIARNPCDKQWVDAPQPGQYEAPVLDTIDVQALLAVADQTPWAMLIYFAVATGMREGEIFALRWADIDFAQGVLRIPKAKTPSGVRAVGLGPVTLERLRQHRLLQMRRVTELGGEPPALVFLTPDCLPMSQPTFWKHWDGIRVAAGQPRLRFHDLRHVQATLLARAGIHPSIAQRRLGHSDARFTMDIYTHVNAADQLPAAIAIEEMLSAE